MSDLKREEESLATWYLQSRHEFVARLALAFAGGKPSNFQALDAGCGIGGISAELRRRGMLVAACDKNPAAIEQGLKQQRMNNAKVADLCRLPYADNAFDLVICSEVLEHVPDDQQALRELLRVSKGPVLITVPAHPYLWTESDRILQHQRRYSRADFSQLLKSAGAAFRPVRAFGALPGLMLLAYRLISLFAKAAKENGARGPLATRFRLPRWADRMLYLLSKGELALSRPGLMPWGHGWWTIAEKSKV